MITSLRTGLKRKLAAVFLCATTMVGMLAPSTAQAKPIAGAFHCSYYVLHWPYDTAGNCSGTFYGTELSGVNVSCATGCSFYLIFDSWSSICLPTGTPTGPGFASGRIAIAGYGDVGSFFWVIAGQTVTIMLPSDSTGAGTQVPLPTLPMYSCEIGGPMQFIVTGAMGVV